MNLFISYARSNKDWVYELWRALRDRARHDPWIDLDIKGAADWWESILEAIEAADCVVYVLSPKAAESIYCNAEIDYALALTKPVIPLMRELCAYPPQLNARRIQYETLTDHMDMGDVLLTISNSLMRVVSDRANGKYVPKAVPRPDVPQPGANPEHVYEAFALAEEAAAEGNLKKAESLYQQVIQADPDGLGSAAAERLAELKYERDRAQAYTQVTRLAANPTTVKGARAAWRAFIQKYGTGYDPNDLAATLAEPPPAPIVVPQRPAPAVLSPPLYRRAEDSPALPDLPARRVERAASDSSERGGEVSSLTLLPKPFDWIPIPAGQVTLITEKSWTANYIPEGQSQTFTVPAFQIAKYPLTNAQFRLFYDARGYDHEAWWTADGWQTRQKEGWSEPRYWQDKQWNKDDYPVVGVSWYEAVAYCRWLAETTGENIMLPTEQQWQRAAQGDTDWVYPYGANFDKNRCNFNTQGTTPVTQYEGKNKGDSPFGVTDMSGNVWEWCLTKYETGGIELDGTDVRVLRGGSWWDDDEDFLRVVYRDGDLPISWVNNGGFRIALS